MPNFSAKREGLPLVLTPKEIERWIRILRDRTANFKQANTIYMFNGAGGTPADAVVAISGSGDDGNLNDNFTSIAEDINELRTAMIEAGIMDGPV